MKTAYLIVLAITAGRVIISILVIIALIMLILALLKYLKTNEIRSKYRKEAQSLGDIIRKHRIDSGMSQEVLAQRLGVTRQAISKWENGSSDPSATNLMALADVFNIKVEDMLKEAKIS